MDIQGTEAAELVSARWGLITSGIRAHCSKVASYVWPLAVSEHSVGAVSSGLLAVFNIVYNLTVFRNNTMVVSVLLFSTLRVILLLFCLNNLFVAFRGLKITNISLVESEKKFKPGVNQLYTPVRVLFICMCLENACLNLAQLEMHDCELHLPNNC